MIQNCHNCSRRYLKTLSTAHDNKFCTQACESENSSRMNMHVVGLGTMACMGSVSGAGVPILLSDSTNNIKES